MTKPRITLVLTALISIYLLHLWTSSSSKPVNAKWVPSVTQSEFRLKSSAGLRNITDYAERPLIAKVSMLYGEEPNPAYVRALRTHLEHNRRHNYDMFVLTEDAVGGFWNKPFYLLSLIMNELAKPPAERLQWLMWVDADLMLVNPSIPLETFLPPTDLEESIHFIGGRDQNGLNTGTFFLKVNPWSVHMLNKALGMPVYKPEIDLGNSFDQVAMSRVMSQDLGWEAADPGNEDELPADRMLRLSQVARPFLFQPREWHNTYEFGHGYEGGDATGGHLLVHFPGLEQARWGHMASWLDELSKNGAAWDVPFAKSIYSQEIPEYWQMVRKSRDLVRKANETLAGMETWTEAYQLLREGTDLCESPMTNTSYDIGPGQDLLARMRNGMDVLGAMLESIKREQSLGRTQQVGNADYSYDGE